MKTNKPSRPTAPAQSPTQGATCPSFRETAARLPRGRALRVAAKLNTCRTITGYGATIVVGAALDAEFCPIHAEASTALGAARARGYVEAYLDCVETAE